MNNRTTNPQVDKIVVIKKDGREVAYNANKIVEKANLAWQRVRFEKMNELQEQALLDFVESRLVMAMKDSTTVDMLHNYVEAGLDTIDPKVAQSYRGYRDRKALYSKDMSGLIDLNNSIRWRGDKITDITKENGNKKATLVAVQRAIMQGEFSKLQFKRTFLSDEELEAVEDGYIYVHDMDFREDTMNCCLFDIANVLNGGFEMANMWYNEPTNVSVAFDVIGDIVLSAASQQYGGFTLPEIDKVLCGYARKSYDKYIKEFKAICDDLGTEYDEIKADAFAWKKVCKDVEQGFQGWEYKFNTVGSSRGDYPFITISFGLSEDRFGRMISKTALDVRAGGQGKKNCKKPVLFPKLVFLCDRNVHCEGGKLEDVYEAAVECSSKAMYPDWLSMSGEGYIAKMYQENGKAISPMGCRAFLSPWYVQVDENSRPVPGTGARYKVDETYEPWFVGRFNIGAVSLHLPMILAKARQEGKDFYEVLDYYLGLIRQIHIRTMAYLGEMKASTNPLAYCEGGFLGGNLGLDDKITPILKSATASFGITAFNELQELYNGKSLVEDGQFALEVLQYINEKIADFKEEDNILYAVYGTPAESLCGKQIKQFRNKYGIIKGVSDREYVSNSFHCHVSEDITPIQKQDLEYRFWELSNGGKIQYVKYPIDYNKKAIKTLVNRAMDMGLYEGINLDLAYCEDCGHQELDMDVCPCCGSRNLTKINRMNGYLAFTREHGETRLGDAKMAEIAERKSM